MPLSEYEQRVLEQMERQLRSDDPKLASALHGRGGSRVRVWVLAAIGGLAGLGMLIGGAAASQPLLGVVGFVVMFGSVLLVFSRPGRGALRRSGRARWFRARQAEEAGDAQPLRGALGTPSRRAALTASPTCLTQVTRSWASTGCGWGAYR